MADDLSVKEFLICLGEKSLILFIVLWKTLSFSVYQGCTLFLVDVKFISGFSFSQVCFKT